MDDPDKQLRWLFVGLWRAGFNQEPTTIEEWEQVIERAGLGTWHEFEPGERTLVLTWKGQCIRDEVETAFAGFYAPTVFPTRTQQRIMHRALRRSLRVVGPGQR